MHSASLLSFYWTTCVWTHATPMQQSICILLYLQLQVGSRWCGGPSDQWRPCLRAPGNPHYWPDVVRWHWGLHLHRDLKGRQWLSLCTPRSHVSRKTMSVWHINCRKHSICCSYTSVYVWITQTRYKTLVSLLVLGSFLTCFQSLCETKLPWQCFWSTCLTQSKWVLVPTGGS